MHVPSAFLLALVLAATQATDALPRPRHGRTKSQSVQFVKHRSLQAKEHAAALAQLQDRAAIAKRYVASADIGGTAVPAVAAPSVAVLTTADGEAAGSLLSVTSPTANTSAIGFDTIPPKLNTSDPAVSEAMSQLQAPTAAYTSSASESYTPAAQTASATTAYAAAATTAAPAKNGSEDPISMALAAAQSYAESMAVAKSMPTITVELVLSPTQVRICSVSPQFSPR